MLKPWKLGFVMRLMLMTLSAFFLTPKGFAAQQWQEHGTVWFGDTQAIMGTEVSVSLWHANPELAQQAVAGVMAIMRGVDQRLSPYIADSELSLINTLAAKQPVKVSAEMARLITQSQHIYALTDGAFDITFASIGKYYDYREKHVPTAEQIKNLLPVLKTSHLHFYAKAQTVSFLSSQVAIDLGGIAKGYACDLAIDYLQTLGIEHAYVSAGGDSRILGDRLGRPWLIGIKNPRLTKPDDKNTVITLPLSNTAVSTSGDYERFFIDQATGERIHHIINPKTGHSATGIISVTILGPEGLGTDPLSTSVFILGVEKGLNLINKMPEYDAVIIDAQGQVHFSEGLMPPSH
jgi:thiamine biosynthesis lipoprotein